MSALELNSTFSILPYLHAEGPHPDYQDKLALFGQFIGVWDMDIQFFDESGNSIFHEPGTWAFSWVLDGRVIQDVIVYADLQDVTKVAPGVRRTGTSLRHYNPANDSWRVVWMGATSGILLVLTPRIVGDEIWLEGREGETALIRWVFTEIDPNHFHWKGLISEDGGQSWRMEQDMLARRRL